MTPVNGIKKRGNNQSSTLDLGSHSNAEDNLLVWSAAEYQSGSSCG
jgi:hypothetical protein